MERPLPGMGHYQQKQGNNPFQGARPHNVNGKSKETTKKATTPNSARTQNEFKEASNSDSPKDKEDRMKSQNEEIGNKHSDTEKSQKEEEFDQGDFEEEAS